MTTPTESDPSPWLARLLQLADPLFPSGAYAHSGGLEEWVRLGLAKDEAGLQAFALDHIAPAQERLELPFVREARSAALAGDVDRLVALDREFEIRKPSGEVRSAGRQIGRRRLASHRAVRDTPFSSEYAARIGRGETPGQSTIVAGVIAAAEAIPLLPALQSHYYLAGAGVCSAALKLLRIGQDGVQRVLRAYLEAAPAAVAASLAIAASDAAWFDPLLDIAHLRHEHAEERLFIS